MTIRSLAEVSARLEDTVSGLPGEPDSPQDVYDRYEAMAIAILDSEHDQWPEGVLEDFLLQHLAAIRLTLDLPSLS